MTVEDISYEDMRTLKINQVYISHQLHDIHGSIEKTNDLLRQLCTTMFYIKELLERD